MNIPILDLKRQYATIKPEIDAAIQRVVESGHFIMGPDVAEFEKEVAEHIGVKHAIGVASGTDALWLSLKAAGVGPGHKVLIPSFTFFATAGKVHNVGAEPVFVDIEPKTFNINTTHLRKLLESDGALRKSAKAIIPVHLYGQIADMDELMAIAAEFKLVVIEDAAQAIGAQYKKRQAGTIGHLGCFSFFPTKNLGAYGDAGMVTTNDDKLADQVKLLRLHGSKPKYFHHIVGTNSRLDTLQAAILRVKLPHLNGWTEARQQHADHYDSALRELKAISIPHRKPDRTHIFHQYTVRVSGAGKRDQLRDFLKEKGIATEVYYPKPLHLQTCFESLGYKTGDLPESERATNEALSLPMFPELKSEEREAVIAALHQFDG